MRLSIILSPLACFLAFSCPGRTAIAAEDGLRQPVIVELFTSEGCSSCPPADAFLQKLDQTQPLQGALVIALSEHVDYWDRLGWKDPFSSPVFTRRQEGYGRSFHLDSAYTPQVVIDGVFEAVGGDTRQIEAAITQSIRANKLRLEISPVFKNSQGTPAVHVRVNPSDKSAIRGETRLTIALAENAVVSHVLRGENSGRKLDHVAVVRSLMDFGRLDSAGASGVDIPLSGAFGQFSGKRIVAFVQDQPYGRIRGAAFRLLSSIAAN